MGVAVPLARRDDRSRVSTAAATWLVRGGAPLYLVLAVAGFVLEAARGSAPLVSAWELFVLLWAFVIGALILRRDPGHPIGWIFCASTLLLAITYFTGEYAVHAIVTRPGSLPWGEAVAWLSLWTSLPAAALLGIFLPLLFPDGHLPSPRWRVAAWLGAGLLAVAVVLAMLAPSGYGRGFSAIRNPIGIESARDAFALAGIVVNGLFLALVFASVLSVFLPVRRADEVQRLQIKWFSYAMVLLFASFLASIASDWLSNFAPLEEVLAAVAMTALPTAVGIAVLRYRLYEIDVLISRTLLYGVLTALLAGLYTASIALFQRLFVATTGQSSDLAIVLTLFVLATLFTPLRTRLQTGMDRYLKLEPVAQGATSTDAGLEDLERLAQLHRRGVLTDDEFAAKKRQILRL